MLVITVSGVVVGIFWMKYTDYEPIEPYVLIVGSVINFLFASIFDIALMYYEKNRDLNNVNIQSYSDKFNALLKNLKSSSLEIDKTFEEISTLSRKKEKTIIELEQSLSLLAQREKELNEKIETLEKVPLQAIKHFEEVLNKGDKRSAYRDYLLFLLGILVSIVISIILKKFNIA